MQSKIFKLSITIFYSIALIFSLLIFFLDDFYIYQTKLTSDYYLFIDYSFFAVWLFFLIFSIVHFLKKNVLKTADKLFWIFLSLFFSFVLVYHVWVVLPKQDAVKS